MRVLISIDMEGVAGIATRRQVDPKREDYPLGRRLMTADANAVIDGAFAGGATEVLVNDAHGPMDNLLAEELDPRAEYVVGAPKPLHMVEQVHAGVDVLLMVGYHAGSTAVGGVLAHTYSTAGAADIRVNGGSMTEAELNGLLAAAYGVPTGLVTGDDQTCAIAAEAFPGCVTVPVKSSLGYTAARCLPPARARELLREGARVAVQRAPQLRPAPLPGSFDVELDLRAPGAVELAVLVPGTEQIAHATVRYRAGSMVELNQVLWAWLYLAGAHTLLV